MIVVKVKSNNLNEMIEFENTLRKVMKRKVTTNYTKMDYMDKIVSKYTISCSGRFDKHIRITLPKYKLEDYILMRLGDRT